jgi:hypothetical protein
VHGDYVQSKEIIIAFYRFKSNDGRCLSNYAQLRAEELKSKLDAVKKEEDALEKFMNKIDDEFGKALSQVNNGFVFPIQPIVSSSEMASFVAQAKDCIPNTFSVKLKSSRGKKRYKNQKDKQTRALLELCKDARNRHGLF